MIKRHRQFGWPPVVLVGLFMLSGRLIAGTLHVDAGNDAGPWDGTPEHPFRLIQNAIDATPGDATILVAPGTYYEHVSVIVKYGIDVVGAGADVTIIDGGFMGSSVVAWNVASGSFRGFTIRNSGSSTPFVAGLFASQSNVTITDNVFRNNHRAVSVGSASTVRIERNIMLENTDYDTIRFTDSFGVIASNVIARNLHNAITIWDSSPDILYNTIEGNPRALQLHPTTMQKVRGNIIVNNNWGILAVGDFTSPAALLDIRYNDLYGNTYDYMEEFSGVSTRPFTPQPGVGEIHQNPLFVDVAARDYHLLLASPCVDTAVPPERYDGVPELDADQQPRILDADGNGLARGDMGAYEYLDSSLTPGEIGSVRFLDRQTLEWNSDPDSFTYSVYRGLTSSLGYANWGTCMGTTSATSFADPDAPAVGAAFYYLVAGRDAGMQEGTLGYAACAERSNYLPCM